MVGIVLDETLELNGMEFRMDVSSSSTKDQIGLGNGFLGR